MTAEDVLALLREKVKEAGSQARYAVDNEIDRSTLPKVLSGRAKIPPQVLNALGLKKIITYEKK